MRPHAPNPTLAITFQPTKFLCDNPRNARTHSKRQVHQIAESIRRFGFLCPIVVTEDGTILAGHGRLRGALHLGLDKVPTVCASGLGDAEQRAYMLADNRLTENAGWDRDRLAIEFGELITLLPPLGLDLSITGFEPPEIDLILNDLDAPAPDPGDQIPARRAQAIARRGEVWLLKSHRVMSGDARSSEDVDKLMAGQRARLTFTDPPYNVRICGHVQGRGKNQHAEFEFASGEMTQEEFTQFLEQSLGNIARVSVDGAIIYVCMDWRHIAELNAAGRAVFTRLMNVVVWNKTSPGQGSFYRSQHELIFVFKVGEAPHVNAFGLGKTGRMRSNVWTYPGNSSFHAGRTDELAMHPTVKPLALVADALRDCSLKGDRVLDLFGGSGTTLMAADKLGRIAYLLEYEPNYVDVTIRRWQRATNLEATLEGDGRTWEEIRAERLDTGPDGAGAAQGTTGDHAAAPTSDLPPKRSNTGKRSSGGAR